jgi:hypothetical protein
MNKTYSKAFRATQLHSRAKHRPAARPNRRGARGRGRQRIPLRDASASCPPPGGGPALPANWGRPRRLIGRRRLPPCASAPNAPHGGKGPGASRPAGPPPAHACASSRAGPRPRCVQSRQPRGATAAQPRPSKRAPRCLAKSGLAGVACAGRGTSSEFAQTPSTARIAEPRTGPQDEEDQSAPGPGQDRISLVRAGP